MSKKAKKAKVKSEPPKICIDGREFASRKQVLQVLRAQLRHYKQEHDAQKHKQPVVCSDAHQRFFKALLAEHHPLFVKQGGDLDWARNAERCEITLNTQKQPVLNVRMKIDRTLREIPLNRLFEDTAALRSIREQCALLALRRIADTQRRDFAVLVGVETAHYKDETFQELAKRFAQEELKCELFQVPVQGLMFSNVKPKAPKKKPDPEHECWVLLNEQNEKRWSDFHRDHATYRLE